MLEVKLNTDKFEIKKIDENFSIIEPADPYDTTLYIVSVYLSSMEDIQINDSDADGTWYNRVRIFDDKIILYHSIMYSFLPISINPDLYCLDIDYIPNNNVGESIMAITIKRKDEVL